MNKLEQAARQALEALELGSDRGATVAHKVYAETKAITALREALAEPDIEEMTLTQIAARHEEAEQEPVAYMFKVKRTLPSSTPLDVFAAIEYHPLPHEDIISKEPLYTHPVRTKDLTDDELLNELKLLDASTARLPIGFKLFAHAVIAKFKEKNK